MVEFVQRYGNDLVNGLIDHVVLTGIAVGVGFVLGLALTLLIVRWRRLETPIAAVTGTLYTIPSLALFALLVPITGLTLVSAEIGLVSYTLLILVRNMLAGLDGVPSEILEAADGMGQTRLQRLVGVELPLAIPLIVAGLRIATVTTVGLVMVTAVIGEGGLGQVLLRGFNLQHWDLVYGALIAMIALAIVADLLLLGLGRLLMPWQRSVRG